MLVYTCRKRQRHQQILSFDIGGFCLPAQFSLFSCIFGKIGRIIDWHPTPAWGWDPSVWRNLDQPLFTSEAYNILSRITISSLHLVSPLAFAFFAKNATYSKKTQMQRITPDLFFVFASTLPQTQCQTLMHRRKRFA